MAKHTTLKSLFTEIANSIRRKNGTTATIIADDFPDVIDAILKPAGTKTITANGTHDVTEFASAQVSVPVGVFPSGSLDIVANGSYDVTNYAGASVNVPSPEMIAVVRTITIPADVTGAPTIHPILTDDEFIKKHYADIGFSATLIAATPTASETNVVHFSYQGNRNIGSTNVSRTGVGLRSTSASAIGLAPLTTPINGTGYGQHLRVNSSGNLYQYLHTDYILKAGTYIIVLTRTP